MKRVFITLIALLIFNFMYSQRVVLYPDRVVESHFHDTSTPLRDKPLVKPTDATKKYSQGEVPNNFEKRKYVFDNGKSPQANDPVRQDYIGVKSVQQGVTQSFDGMSRFEAGGAIPPDCSGDVSSEYYVQMVNLAFEVYDKAGNSLYGPVANNVLFDGWDDGEDWDNTNDGDPIVLYDDQADRWIVSHFSLPNWGAPYYMLIAYSTTGDPTGSYHRYAFELNNFPDYPKLGIWNDGLYITFNSNSGQAAVFERDSMLVGAPARMIQFTIPDYPGGGFRSALAADCDGPFPPAGTPNYLLYYNDDGWGQYPTDHLRIWEFDTDWSNTSNSTLTLANTLITEAFDSNFGSTWSNITQPGTQKLDAIAQAMMFRLQYRKFPNHESMLCNYVVDVDGTDHAGIRWYELRKETGSWYIYQQGTYAPDEHNRWNASMSMDSIGNIAMAYSVSSSTVYPSLRFTGHTIGGQLGVMDVEEVEIIAGSGSQSGTNRFGDYATMGVDPSDDLTFWFNSEYIPSNGQWRTRIASFKFDEVIVPSINASAVSIDEPVSAIDLGNEVYVEATFSNAGSDTIFEIPVSLIVNDSLIVTDTIFDAIPGLTNFEHIFSTAYDFSNYQIYEVEIISHLLGDTIPEDDTLMVEIESIEPYYCDASGAVGGEYISLVEFRDTSYQVIDAAYADNLSDTLVMKQGGNYDFTVSVTNGASTDQLIVWFDWNRDKDFLDAGEKYYFGFGSGPFTSTISVPMDALIGDARVRMRLHDTQNGPNQQPCGASTYGSVADFSLKVVDPLGEELIIPNNILMEAYPNPTQGNVNLFLQALPYNSFLQLIDAEGKEIQRWFVNSGEKFVEDFSLAHLPSGLYFLRLRLENQDIIKVEKIIKQ